MNAQERRPRVLSHDDYEAIIYKAASSVGTCAARHIADVVAGAQSQSEGIGLHSLPPSKAIRAPTECERYAVAQCALAIEIEARKAILSALSNLKLLHFIADDRASVMARKAARVAHADDSATHQKAIDWFRIHRSEFKSAAAAARAFNRIEPGSLRVIYRWLLACKN